jgi:ketosteroid isomerase-like protein
MTAEQNAALVRRYFEDCVSRAGLADPAAALATLDELMASDFSMSYNNATEGEAERGRDAHKAFLFEHARNFPEDRWTIETLIADGESVACQWRIRSKHARSGNSIDVRAGDFFRVRDGRLTELRRFLDFTSLGEQTRRRADSSSPAHSGPGPAKEPRSG